jgi:hypothetical protein
VIATAVTAKEVAVREAARIHCAGNPGGSAKLVGYPASPCKLRCSHSNHSWTDLTTIGAIGAIGTTETKDWIRLAELWILPAWQNRAWAPRSCGSCRNRHEEPGSRFLYECFTKTARSLYTSASSSPSSVIMSPDICHQSTRAVATTREVTRGDTRIASARNHRRGTHGARSRGSSQETPLNWHSQCQVEPGSSAPRGRRAAHRGIATDELDRYALELAAKRPVRWADAMSPRALRDSWMAVLRWASAAGNAARGEVATTTTRVLGGQLTLGDWRVELRPFYPDRYEVSVNQYWRCIRVGSGAVRSASFEKLHKPFCDVSKVHLRHSIANR